MNGEEESPLREVTLIRRRKKERPMRQRVGWSKIMEGCVEDSGVEMLLQCHENPWNCY